jgi:hypothetical protein
VDTFYLLLFLNITSNYISICQNIVGIVENVIKKIKRIDLRIVVYNKNICILFSGDKNESKKGKYKV